MLFIDLGDDLSLKDTTLQRVELGHQLRDRYELSQVDTGKQEVTVIIPHQVRAVMGTFVRGMFGQSLRTLKLKGFQQKYHFEGELHAVNQMNGEIQALWQDISKPKESHIALALTESEEY